MTYAEKVKALADCLGKDAGLCSWAIVCVGIDVGCSNTYRTQYGLGNSTENWSGCTFSDGSAVESVNGIPKVKA